MSEARGGRLACASLGAALLQILACSPAPGPDPPGNPPDGPPNVLLITLDTTRADALGAYGGALARTPRLDALAAESVVFRQAVSTAPYTGPSHASMLTGLFPPQHGLRDYLVQRLPESATTLAEILGESGFATAAFVSAYTLDPAYGLAQGFDVYRARVWEPPGGSVGSAATGKDSGLARLFFQRRADNTVDEALHWLGQRDPSQPFFAWVHFYDPHAPYDPPEGFRPAEAELAKLEQAERTRRLYYAEVTWTDSQVGRLFDGLDALGIYDDLVVVVVADHGELLGLHGRPLGGHSPMLVDATVRVPLLVRAPRRLAAGGVVDDQVRVVDVFPTVLEAAGLAVPDGVEGISLFEVGSGGRPRPGFSETFYEHAPARAEEGSELRSLRLAGWKLVAGPEREQLFDLGTDPGEQRDLSAERPEELSRLREELAQLTARWPAGAGDRQLDLPEGEEDDHLERLRALGYVE